jgi:MurNAc alpha-1-phosphate uridylyltransferase
MINQALILAAGLGVRMRPITNKIPKPMVEVCNQSLITRIIDELYKAGIEKIVINLFYKAELLQNHVENYVTKHYSEIKICFVLEEELHESWGSINKCLHEMNNKPFFLINGDNYWIDTNNNIFELLYSKWDSKHMKALLLLYPKPKSIGYDGKGDFDLQEDRIIEPALASKLPFVYMGLQIISPDFLKDEKLRKCSIFDIYKQFNYENIYGIVYDGYWFHIGTPESITETEYFIKEHQLLK